MAKKNSPPTLSVFDLVVSNLQKLQKEKLDRELLILMAPGTAKAALRSQDRDKIHAAWTPWVEHWTGRGGPTERIRPNHPTQKTVSGWSLPPETYLLKVGPFDSRRPPYGILQTFLLDKQPLERIEWLLRAGFNPNWFDGKVTSVGLAAYTGQVAALQLFYRWGADLELKLTGQHGTPKDSINSTLLFRVMEREFFSAETKLKVVRFLAQKAHLPIEPTHSGRTVFDLPDQEAVAAVQEILAKREKQLLIKSNPSRRTANPSQKRI